MLTLLTVSKIQVGVKRTSNHRERLFCSSCSVDVGAIDPLSGGWKLDKLSMSIEPSNTCIQGRSKKIEQAPKINGEYSVTPIKLSKRQMIQRWISAQFLILAENENAHTFLVKSNCHDAKATNEKYDCEQTEPSNAEAAPKPLLVS